MTSHSILEINTNIIKDNYSILKQLSTSEVAAAVKANAYGLGATEIVEILITSGCSKFFVATLDEALSLRKNYKNISIYVLSGLAKGDEHYFFEENLIPILNSVNQIEIINNFAKSKNTRINAILHLDSGMNRLGIPSYEAGYLCDKIDILSNINLDFVMSHLAASETDTSYNLSQLDKFLTLKKQLSIALSTNNNKIQLKGSIANSAGILLGEEYHLDLVRPGAAIYGLNLNNKMSVFRNPIRLFSKLIQVKNLCAGDSLGYNLTYQLPEDSVIGTIPVGYADGLFRSLSNIGACYINGYEAKIIGRISMDLINLDLKNIPPELRKEGQEVDIICKHQTPDMLAQNAGTIGYEILTSLGNRYKRRYLK